MHSIFSWLILLAPLASATVITLFTLRSKSLSSAISSAAVLVSFCCSCFIFAKSAPTVPELVWIDITPIFRVPLGLTLDQLSRTMGVLVSGVGALIHIYSLGYMRNDEGKSRYFAALSLFMFAMLGIVFANNFVMLFIFWELVGFTSYVLIGHWFFRDSAADAANKAFITTRIGDFGFMTGILMIWMTTGSVVFAEIAPRMPMFTGHATFVAIVALLIFCGAVGKSAQLPLHVVLPDAMQGATPRSVIVMLHHEQNIWKMGGLRHRLPITFAAFGAGALALIGCPPFSGFFSKDAILAVAYEHNLPIFVVALFTAFLTAFYVIRMLVIVFFGNPRSDSAREGRESPPVMTMPLIVLSILATLGGFAFFTRNFLKLPTEKAPNAFGVVPVLAIIALILGVGLAFALYRGRATEPVKVELLRRKFYFDEFYCWLIYWTQELLAPVAAFIDRWVIDAGAVGGSSRGTWGIGALLRLIQVGNLQAYAFLFGLGVIALIYFAVFRF